MYIQNQIKTSSLVYKYSVILLLACTIPSTFISILSINITKNLFIHRRYFCCCFQRTKSYCNTSIIIHTSKVVGFIRGLSSTLTSPFVSPPLKSSPFSCAKILASIDLPPLVVNS